MKLFNIAPVTGFTDARSEPIEVPVGGWRWAQNVGVVQLNKLCRQPGWQRLLDTTPFNNSDLHNPLTDITGGSGPKPINLLFEAESLRGQSTLIAGTDDALLAFNPATANWRVINDANTGPWKSIAQVRDTAVATNGVDAIVSYALGSPPIGSDLQSTSAIPDLAVLGITRVDLVVAWRDVMFYMGVVQAGQYMPNRILWSDKDHPLSLLPADALSESIAGDHDLDSNEVVLNAEPIGNSLFIYTTRSIWEMVFSGGDEVFSFGKRYSPNKSGEACLGYRNTLVNTGEDHIYLGRDGIYLYNLFLPKPKRVDWIHRGSAVIFDDINSQACDAHVGEYFPDRKEVWFSWAQAGRDIPSRTFVINVEFPFSSVVDHGFTAFAGWTPKAVEGIRDFFLERCICNPVSDFDDATGGFVKEGGVCYTETVTTCAEGDLPDSIYSSETLELEDGVIMEDFEDNATSNSICSKLDDITVADLCASTTAASGCRAQRLFVAASSSDYTLKQMADVYYREAMTNRAGCGVYERQGYRTILRSGPLDMGDRHNEKEILRFFAEASAALESNPAQVALRIGAASTAVDPNDATCAILWFDEFPKFMECLSEISEVQHKAQGTRPNTQYEWPTYNIGRYIYFELTVLNDSVTPKDTGGSVCFSRFEMTFKLAQRRM